MTQTEAQKRATQKWREAHRDRYNAYHRAYAKANPQRLTRSQRRIALRLEIIESLGGKCSACGIDDPRLLEFDHIDRSKKRDNLNALLKNESVQRAWEESTNCRLLCANCHRLKSMDNGDWRRVLTL